MNLECCRPSRGGPRRYRWDVLEVLALQGVYVTAYAAPSTLIFLNDLVAVDGAKILQRRLYGAERVGLVGHTADDDAIT